MSFSSTFVLATLRSVITEILHERKARKRFLLGEQPKDDTGRNDRRSNVMIGLQRQFSVVFRWRSECAEDELHLEEHMIDRKTELDPEAPPILEETFDDELVDEQVLKDACYGKTESNVYKELVDYQLSLKKTINKKEETEEENKEIKD